MTMRTGVFVTGTGTSVGKTWVSRGLSRALRQHGVNVAAIKPIETGWNPEHADAVMLAKACDRPEIAHAAGWYRAKEALAPYAIEIQGSHPPLVLDELVQATEATVAHVDYVIVEGAGGFYVPISKTHTMADLVTRLRLPAILVSHDQLGVLSWTLSTAECMKHSGVTLAAVVLVQGESTDASTVYNQRILEERLSLPVVNFPYCDNTDEALALAAAQSGLLEICLAMSRLQ